MISKIIVLQASGKDHLKYIKGRAVKLWESRGMGNGKLRDCIKEILKEHCELLTKQIRTNHIPSRCDYCGAIMAKKEVKECSPYCRVCWKKHFLKVKMCEICGVKLLPEHIDNYENYCEWCWRQHILKS